MSEDIWGEVLSVAFKAYRDRDYQKALEYFKQAADMGDAMAYGMLGFMYKNGEGVEKDYQKAIEYYQKAADMGDAMACFNLGSMYYVGVGVEKDLQKAEEYFKKARELGVDC
ncbi:tetratricopeptide repeat protein [Helicobacter suis]|uniref:tetratricopeptide repeat protein n=1 Tax=Helicobacter suis TaxID=104628 RepID=UPI0013D2FB4D|nr:tetratricopeptide repeat protein [Helicobacter suis]